MNFRATFFSTTTQAIRFASQHSADLQKYQSQISSGIQLQRPSDNPVNYRYASSLGSRLEELRTELTASNTARSSLEASLSQVQEASLLLTSARSLAQQGVQASFEERNALAIEVDGLLEQMKSIANAEFGDAYLYSGTTTSKRPFEFSEDNTGALKVTYHGSSSDSEVAVGTSIVLPSFYAGDKVFDAVRDRGDTILTGNSGARSGVGTDNVRSRTQLLVSHTNTIVDGTSGVTSGISSGLDTIIGPHQLQVNNTSGVGTSGTVSLNGGPDFQFTDGSNNLEVTGPQGERVFLDLTNLQHGFVGPVNLTGEGSLSIDAGQTSIPIDFSDQQIVNHGSNGTFVVIDSREIYQAAEDTLEFPGTANAFQVLYELAQDLRNENALTEGELAERLDRRLTDLEDLQENFLNTVGKKASSLQLLDKLTIRIEELELQTESRISTIQNTNVPEAVLRMENSRVLLEYTYAVTAQINSLGILDFLR